MASRRLRQAATAEISAHVAMLHIRYSLALFAPPHAASAHGALLAASFVV